MSGATPHRDRHPPAEPVRAAGPGTGLPSLSPVPRLLQRLVRGLGNVLLLVVVLAFAGLAVGPHVLGYRTMTMLTRSMAPGHRPRRRHRRGTGADRRPRRRTDHQLPDPRGRPPRRQPPGHQGERTAPRGR